MYLRLACVLFFCVTLIAGCKPVTAPAEMAPGEVFQLDGQASGSLQTIDHIDNLTVVVHDGKMWHLGSGDDVWNSTDGVNWTRTIESLSLIHI